VSAQFHAGHRGGFDAFRSETQKNVPYGKTTFPWFEVDDLSRRIAPPPGIRIVFSLTNQYLVVRRRTGPSCSEELGVLPKNHSKPRWLGLDLYPSSAIESRTGELWAVVRGAVRREGKTPTVHLLRISPEGKVEKHRVDVSDWGHDAELALTADDRAGLVFLRRQGGRLQLVLSWAATPTNEVIVDEVIVPVAVAELSQRSHVSISVAPEGKDGLGVAWRPLVDTDASGSWTHTAAAEVRWLTVGPDGRRTSLHRHATTAEPLSFHTGLGPYGLQGNGLTAGVLEDRALFAWIDGTKLLATRTTDAVPAVLLPSASPLGYFDPPLIALRPRGNDVEVLLLHSSQEVVALLVGCR
jgi:hypothetical protein